MTTGTIWTAFIDYCTVQGFSSLNGFLFILFFLPFLVPISFLLVILSFTDITGLLLGLLDQCS